MGSHRTDFHAEVIKCDHSSNCIENTVLEKTSTTWLVGVKELKTKQPTWEAPWCMGTECGWMDLDLDPDVAISPLCNLGQLFNAPDLCFRIY